MRALVVLALLAPGVVAADDAADADLRPTGLLFRATPGLGYAFDDNDCPLAGRMFAGGFALGYALAPGVVVGASTTISFNTLLRARACDMDTRVAIAIAVGPMVDFYPVRDLALRVVAMIGYSEIDNGVDDRPTRGLGGMLGAGYDWYTTETPTGTRFRLGTQVQVATFASSSHLRAGDMRRDLESRAWSPSVLFTFAVLSH